MKTLAITLPDQAFIHAEQEGEALGLDVATLCTGILSDHFLSSSPKPISGVSKPRATNLATPNTAPAKATGAFEVAQAFPGFPARSVELAQRFIDAALKLPNVIARRHKNGIDIRPNFVRIEALLSRAGRSGIRVSFYDRDGQFTNPPQFLTRGMGNYKRAVVQNADDLAAIIPLIDQAYALKFGGSGA